MTRRRRALEVPAPLRLHDARCVWRLELADGEVWQTSCGGRWQFTTDGPTENGVLFCMRCGKRVAVERPPVGA